jgi:hypothetical protein
VLIDRRNLWKLHGRWIVAASAATLAAATWVVAEGTRAGRWPGGGSIPGLALGILAAAIFVFELAIVGKKTRFFRTARWTLSAQAWMKTHIWLGLLTVPLVVLHSGGRFGGIFTTLFVAIFALVIASGLWGLALQNVLPKLLLEAAPAETIYSQIDDVGRQYAGEARRLVLVACGGEDDRMVGTRAREPLVAAALAGQSPIPGAARNVGLQVQRQPHPAGEQREIFPSTAIQDALARDIEPFLIRGEGGGPLGSRQRNQWYFDDLRLRVPRELRELAGQLEELCERRRQLNLQRRLHFWLHNWLWLHLPLSVALVVLLLGHIFLALRFG